MIKKVDAEAFIFKTKRVAVRVYCDDIVFFESCGHYITIHMKNGEVYQTREKMNVLDEMMDKESFLRIHRGIMVNLKYVEGINRADVLLKLEWGRVPVSRAYKKKLYVAFEEYKLKADNKKSDG